MALRRGGAAVRSTVRTWFAGATAPRYLPFALFNAAYAGIAGLVIPRLAGDAARAGLTWAAFYLASGVASLAWGRLVGRWGRRATLLVGLALTLLGLAALATVPGAALPLAAALLGGGGAAVQLVATLFVLAWFPQSRWDTEIAALETWMGAGQALGLALLVSASSMVTAAWLGVLILGLAYPLGAVLPDPNRPTPAPARVPRPRLLHGLEGATVPPHWHVAALRPRDLTARLETPLALLLGRWGVLLVGSIPVGAFIPLALQHAADLPAGRVSAGLALVTALGVAVYRPAGRASHLCWPFSPSEAGSWHSMNRTARKSRRMN